MELRVRFFVEAALAVANSGLLLLTLLWPDWIERVFQIDPDQGAGSFERMLCVLGAAGALGFSVLARREWKRSRPIHAVR